MASAWRQCRPILIPDVMFITSSVRSACPEIGLLTVHRHAGRENQWQTMFSSFVLIVCTRYCSEHNTNHQGLFEEERTLPWYQTLITHFKTIILWERVVDKRTTLG